MNDFLCYLVRRGRDGSDGVTHGLGQLDSHLTQASDANNADPHASTISLSHRIMLVVGLLDFNAYSTLYQHLLLTHYHKC